MKLLVDVFSSVLEVLVLYYFFHRVLSVKRDSTVLTLSVSAICVVLITIVSNYLLKSNIAPILFFLVVILYCFVLYKDKIIKKILYSLMIYIFTMLSEVLVGIVLTVVNGIDIETTQSNVYTYLQGIIISKLILFFIFRIINLFEFNKRIEINLQSILAVLVIPLSSIISIYYFAMIAYKTDNAVSSAVLLIVTALTILSNISTFYLLEKQITLQKTEESLSNIEKQYKLQADYYTELKQNMLVSDKTAHDIKNFVAAVTAYIDSGKIDLAAEKLEEFVGKMPVINRVDTGNDAVNALIQSKMPLIDKNIPNSHVSVLLPKDMSVDEIDLCILIGNALDNAIEACLRIGTVAERELGVKIFPANEQISMLFENSMVGEPKKAGGKLKTSKKDTYRHGFGIENMKNICAKYGGSIVFDQVEQRFSVSVLLPN